jgi:hypothetical protein
LGYNYFSCAQQNQQNKLSVANDVACKQGFFAGANKRFFEDQASQNKENHLPIDVALNTKTRKKNAT